MRRKIWKKLLSAGCAVSLLATVPGMNVLADQIQEEEIIVTEAENPEQIAEPIDGLQEDVIDEIEDGISEEDSRSEENEPSEEVDASSVSDEEEVGTGEVVVGDGVTATFNDETGTVEIISEDGTLFRDWIYQSGFNKSKIKSIKIKSGTLHLPADCLLIFAGCGLTNFDSINIDTSNVTNMSNMFENCSELSSLDLCGFNTSNVKDMTCMFEGCESLTHLNLSEFDTSSVTHMYGMFKGCKSLTDLDLSNFDTSNVVHMNGYDVGMFQGCSSLISLNLSRFNTSATESMEYMFCDCGSLASLDLTGFDTSNVTDMNRMFFKCSNLTSLNLSSFDTSNVTDMGGMFYACSSLINLDLKNFETSKLTRMSEYTINGDYGMFSGCSSLTELNLCNFDTSNVTSMAALFADCYKLTELDLSSFNTSNVTDMEAMFRRCSKLKKIDVSNFDTSKVQWMGYMFYSCQVTELDVSSFDTSKVREMDYMFGSCSQLEELDVSNFNTSSVTQRDYTYSIEGLNGMFSYCRSLRSLDLSSFDTTKVEGLQAMFEGCSSLANLELGSFNTSNAKSLNNMFKGCKNLVALDLSGFNTSKVTNMDCMFYNCASLKTLDLSRFDTTNVTGMRRMFYNCSSIQSLDLSNFNTANVVGMNEYSSGSYEGMFGNCSSLIELNFNGADMSNVTDMRSMFKGCSSLSTLNLSGVVTANVMDMQEMFYNCGSLTELDLSGFDTSNVTNMSRMFSGCKSLSNLILSSFNTSNVSKMESMFSGCSSLEELNLSSFNTSNVSKMENMFSGCSSLVELDISSFDTSNVSDMNSMFYGCSSLVVLNLKNFDTSNATDMHSVFSGCGNLTDLNLSSFDTSSVENLSSMFSKCSSLINLDLSCFDTVNATDMSYMFNNCSNLSSLDLSGFDTSNVTNMCGMFEGCTELTTLDLSSFNTSKVTRMNYSFNDAHGMFKGCTSLMNLDLSSFDTSKVGSMAYMFYGCSSLTNLDLSKFNTSKVGSMAYMFYGCNSLTNLDLSNFNTSSVENMYDMFRNCSSLTDLDLSGFDTSNVTWSMETIFYGCTSLLLILTPKNNSKSINLPITMYDRFGNLYTSLLNIKECIVIAKTQQMAQAYANGVDPAMMNAFTLTKGPVNVKVGGKAAIIAAYYDENGKLAEAPGTISWGTSNGPDTGKVSIRPTSDYYECYLCEITGVTEGRTLVSAQTEDGRYANVVVNVMGTPSKETRENAGVSEHMSGSNNYVLERTKQGVFDIKDGITSGVMIDGASVYTAKNKIIIKSGGELIVTGTLNAADIVVKTGGYLDVDGRLNAGTVTFEGGNWLSQGGFLKGLTSGVIFADNVIFKGKSDTNFDGQIIAKQKFEYKSSEEPSEMSASLYIGGNLKVNDHFTGMQGKIKTIFYGKTSDCKFEVGKKSNLGKVYASSADAFHDTGIGSDNHMGAFQYRNLKKPDDKKWSFTATSTSLERASEKSWANGLSAVYIDLLKNKQTAVDVSSVLDSSLSADESKMINQIAEAWIATIYAQGPKGLLEIKEAVFDLPFTLNRKSYFLRYELTSYGQYSEIGKISFGKDEKNLKPVGLTAAASITAFKTQATSYLAERYVQEYYKFVTGNIPKWETDSWVIGKLKRGGVDYVKNYMEKMLFQTLTVSEPQSYKDLAKTLKLGKLMLKGDVGGLWKFAIKEVSGAVSNRSVSKNSPGTAVGLQYLSSVGGSENLSGSSESIDSITDIHLKEALIELLGEDANGEPDFSKQANIERLELGGRYIQSLNGLQRFTNLETLILNNNEIKDVSALKGMTSLRYLDISGQEIQDLSPLSGLTDLVVLDVGDNDITSLRPLEALTSLNTLDISNNPVTSLEGLSEMTGLQTLRASGLILSGGLKEFSGLNKLQEVYMEGCGLTDLQGLNTDSLRILDVSSNQIENLDPILMAARLEALDISENAICQIPSLAGCVSLKEADISGNMLIEMDGICDAAVLEILNFSACELTNTDMEILGGIPALKTLDISYNSIIDDISAVLAIPTLEKVDVTRTKVSLEGLTDTVEIIKEETQEEEDDKIDISGLTVTLTVTSYSYDGKEKKPAVTVMDGNAKLTVGTDYTVTYLNNINAGTATVKVEGMGNYKGEKTLTFAINKPASSGFSDVQDPKHAYYKAIYWAADEGITKGYPDGTFGINKSCTRGEMIMFLWRYAGKPAPKAVSKSPFKDVAKSHAFYKAILWASQKGITKGYPDGTFGINRNVSRGECMMFLWRLKGKPAPKAVSVSPFKDVPKTHAFYNAILWGYQKKITTGYTSGAKKGTFGINENCTRGAIVTFLYRAR